ncbi:TPA: signal peptidase I, partial [Pseudomonas aeruginosa]
MGLLAAIMLAVYLANPFGTASLDPRARLLGVALYKIPSRSMEPTLQQGDFILANAARYAFADPQVGDLVVFRFPPQRSIAYVKRIAGIPGDRVRIDGGRLYVNDHQVTEP